MMGGENREYEVADFPKLRKRMIKLDGKTVVYDLDSKQSIGPLDS